MAYYLGLTLCILLFAALVGVAGTTGGVATLELVFVLVVCLAIAGLVVVKTTRDAAS